MVAAPADLIWECVKDHSSFRRKSRDAPVMTAEPTNLMGLNLFKYSGLAAKKALDVNVVTTGKKQTVTLTRTHMKQGRFFRPGCRQVKCGLKKETKKGVAKIADLTEGCFYRKDLKELAVKKYMKIKQSFKKNKTVPVKKVKNDK
mmetsp:Transcript_64579/g.204179  ORF Transcript_64579/g.204179 Transcript_64579/m.204179 type:complete len:145 (-) Transcript_64579:158-592(-)